MKVSVIIPTFNRAHTLARAIDSVLGQSHENFELIIVDDGSTDNTVELLKSYGEKLKYFTTENKGVSAARNFGVKNSDGRWLAFLDSDDEWLPEKLAKQLELLIHFPNLPLIHGEEIWVRNGKRVNQKKKHKKAGGSIYQMCLPLCCISPSAAIIKREVYQELGGFDEEFVVCEDYDLWLKITSLHEVGFVPTPIINKYGGHEDQLSSKYKAMDLWRVRAMNRILDIRELQTSDREATIEELLRKINILKLGYTKHGNVEHLDELNRYLTRRKA